MITITGTSVVTQTRTYLGVRFRHQGRRAGDGPGSGIDCAGLIVLVAQDLGLSNFDFLNYTKQPYYGTLKKILDDNLEKISVLDLQAGDILLMRFDKEPQHLAIYTGENTIIHSLLECKKCTEHRYTDVWKQRTVAYYRYKGVGV
jgi:cell wall-associated NlpC family hydrolase